MGFVGFGNGWQHVTPGLRVICNSTHATRGAEKGAAVRRAPQNAALHARLLGCQARHLPVSPGVQPRQLYLVKDVRGQVC